MAAVGETNRAVYVLQLIWIPGVFREPNIGWNPIIEQMFYNWIGFVTKFEDVARRLETSAIPTPVGGSLVGGWWGSCTGARSATLALDRTRVPAPDPSTPLGKSGRSTGSGLRRVVPFALT
jgi:hypothetical protein